MRISPIFRLTFLIMALAILFGMESNAQSVDFTLDSTENGTLSSTALEGKVVVLSFGYMSCPDVCPTTLFTYKVLLQAIGRRAECVAPVFVSVDPKRDSVEALREYLAHFDESIIGLTGSSEALRDVAKQFGTHFRYETPNESGGYHVDHSSNIYLIDPEGTLARIVPYGMPAEMLIRSVESLLDQECTTRPAPS